MEIARLEIMAIRVRRVRPSRRAERLGEVPLGRIASVDDVANAFVCLASGDAGSINGIALPADGELSAG